MMLYVWVGRWHSRLPEYGGAGFGIPGNGNIMIWFIGETEVIVLVGIRE